MRARKAIPEQAAEIEKCAEDLRHTVEDLRLLVRGRIFPSALREAGLLAALEVATTEFPFGIDIDGDEPVRADAASEIAAYLCVIDLLQAGVRAECSWAVVRVQVAADVVTSVVQFDRRVPVPQIVRDRAAGLDASVVETADTTSVTIRQGVVF